MDLRQLQTDPALFRQSLIIDCDGQSRRLGTVLDDWQNRDFAALDPGWLAVTGQTPAPKPISRAWLERSRGHSKTSDLAVMATWALFASRNRIAGYAAAADRDQAKLLRNAIDSLVRQNGWLSKILKVNQWQVTNPHTGSSLEIISSDAPTSYGLTPHFIIVDEITHWQNRDLWDSLISSAAKRGNCMVVVITNAGFGESWQWVTREIIRQNPAWYFSHLNGPKASWITPDRLAEQRRLLPEIAYRRLWLNEWTTGSGDALTATDIQTAIRLNGPLPLPEKGWVYFAGLDLGLSRDKAAFAVVGAHVGFHESTEKPRELSHTQQLLIEAGIQDAPEPEFDETNVEGTGRLRLAQLKVWDPADSTTGKVSIEEVEQTIVEMDQRFRLRVGCDPWQSAYLQERLVKRNVPTEPVNFTAQILQSMCSATLEAFAEGNIELFPDPQLLHDLQSLRVVEKSYGVRLDSPRGLNGHGDTATALAISLHLAKNCSIGLSGFSDNRKLVVYP